MLMRAIQILLLVPLVMLAGCSNCSGQAPPKWVETGDLEALQQHGVLRVVVPGTVIGEPSLPRVGSPMAWQRELAEGFARFLGLEMELVPVFHLGDMLPLLEEGRADLIAANLTITESRLERVDFSLPIDHVQEVVMVAANKDHISGLEDLAGKSIMADPATSFWDSLTALQESLPDLRLVPRPAHFDDEAMLDAVARGRVDATVRDSNIAEMYLAYRQDLQVAFSLGETQAIAWAVRKDTPQLLAALNRFLTMEQLTRPRESHYFGDLSELKERRVLRIMLPNTAASYFLWRGELVGFEYELARRFAEKESMRLEVIVPPNPDIWSDWLLEGRADLAGGFLEHSDLPTDKPVVFTRPWHHAQPYLVGRANGNEITEWEELAGHSVAVVSDSQLWWDLSELATRHGFSLIPLPNTSGDVEPVVERLIAEDFDYAVIEEHLLAVELARHNEIQRLFPVGVPIAHAWAVRDSDSELLEALNDFIQSKHRGTFYNILYRRYFEDERRIRRQQDERVRGTGQLSPYDEIVRKLADEYGFDWRLVIALIYQESRFDREAKSPMGAKGLMQLMPRTAQQMGVTRITDPNDNVRGGIKYLDWLRQRFSEDLPVADRLWFTLASYNAGLGHVIDARRLAEQKGWDRDRWFDNVEHAMLLLAQRKYYSEARHGYVRGSETVAYLNNISQRYKAYVQLTEEPPLLSQRDD